ncbi:MAG TPA: hypothetical protein VKZ53_22205 [Candidatus Angelobacter sp.]|nr:hypothetical protein [Candidatus Angelobacter sp.]
MKSVHIQAGVIKSYLLGVLPQEEASVIEERYFAEPEFFDRIRAIEMDLICEFLDGTLTADERDHFNRRCLQSPRLTKLVHEVQVRREVYKSQSTMSIGECFSDLVRKILEPEKTTKEKPKE